MARTNAARTTAATRPSGGKPPRKRAYRMQLRAASAEATLERVLDAASELFSGASYDEVSLEAIARRARVSLPTVLRKFGSKDGLLLACARGRSGREIEARA